MIDISANHMKKYWDDFGTDSFTHTRLLIEEMSELTKELTKYDRYCDQYRKAPSNSYEELLINHKKIRLIRDNIIEEMAHVYICLKACRGILDIKDDEINTEIKRKEI